PALGIAFGGFTNRGEEAVDLVFGQADAVVANFKRGRLAARCRQRKGDFTAMIWRDLLPSCDRVDSVLQQLAQKNLRAAIEVIGQQLNDAAQVDLKSMGQRCLPDVRL